MSQHSSTAPARSLPDGTRLALMGAVIYLLEWVVILTVMPPGPFGPGSSTDDITADYAADAGPASFAAGWFAVVLVGRVLYMTAVKASLRRWPGQRPLLDLGVAAMAIAVVLEIACYAVVAGAARVAADGGDSATVVGLDNAAYWLWLCLFGPIGIAVLATSVAMLASRAFPSWVSWLGIVAGVAGIAAAIVAGATTDSSPSSAADVVSSVGAVGMWVWMLATGIYLWRQPRLDGAAT